jgi:hypothetical protein
MTRTRAKMKAFADDAEQRELADPARRDTKMIVRPGKERKAIINAKLDNGMEQRWIQVVEEEALEQILEYVGDTSRTKVRLQVREMDIWRMELQDGDRVTMIGKGMGGLEMMVRVWLNIYDREMIMGKCKVT